jgi:hypothetical protein
LIVPQTLFTVWGHIRRLNLRWATTATNADRLNKGWINRHRGFNENGLNRRLRRDRVPHGRCDERRQAWLFGLNRHRFVSWKPPIWTAALIASAFARWTLIALFAGLKLTLLAGLEVARWTLITLLTGLEFPWLARLKVAACRSIPRLALFARLEITIVTRWPWSALIAVIPWLIGLLAGLELALRFFFTLRRALTKRTRFGLSLPLTEGALFLTLFTICFRLVEAPETGIGDAELFLGGCNQAEIMLGMLKKALSRHVIAGCLRVTSELNVFFRDILRRAAYFDVRTVRFIRARQRIWTFTAAATAAIATVTATHALVLMIRSHRTTFFSIIIHDG